MRIGLDNNSGSNIIGNRYGKLTVIEELSKRVRNRKAFLCKCDCGNTKEVLKYNLVSGNTKSCGCLNSNNITGNRYGKLTVIEETDKIKHNNRIYLCKCDCGNTKEISRYNLVSGNTKSCGCIKSSDIIGNRYGKLTVIEETGKIKHTHSVFLCKCDCGNTTEVTRQGLISNDITSCGCIRSSDIVGNRYGKLTVIEETDKRRNGSKVYLCKCDCGNTKEVSRNSLKAGNTNSCGCLRKTRKINIYRDIKEE